MAARLKALISGNDLLLSLIVAMVVVIVGVLLGWHSNRIFPANPISTLHYTAEPGNHLSLLSDWDGPAYLNIVGSGYLIYPRASLFPFYPITIYLVHLVVPSALDSALLVSWLSFVVAIYFYIKIIKKLYGTKKTENVLQAVTFFVLFPTAIFFIASYTESLFAMLALGAIYFVLTRRIVWSALLLMLSTATHITGVFVLILTALMLLEQKEKIYKVFLYAAVGSLGIFSYTYYLHLHFHDALAFLHSQTQLNGWTHQSFSNIITSGGFFNFFFIFLLLVSFVFWWRRRRSFAIYSILFLLIPLVGREYGGFNRYVLMAFPVQLMLYEYFQKKKAALPYAVAATTIIWTLFLIQYAGGWTGTGR